VASRDSLAVWERYWDLSRCIAPLSQAGLIIAEHLEPGHCDAEETISKLIAVLDAQELADASDRLEVATGCVW
jgi:hypothetical protein